MEEFHEKADHWWQAAFRIDKVTTFDPSRQDVKSGRRKFAFSIQTDGLSVSVRVRKPAGHKPDVNMYGFEENGTFHPLDIREGDRVIGIDPGRIDLFVGAFGESKKDSVQCSLKEYYSLAGFVRGRVKREKWYKGNPDVQAILRGKNIAY